MDSKDPLYEARTRLAPKVSEAGKTYHILTLTLLGNTLSDPLSGQRALTNALANTLAEIDDPSAVLRAHAEKEHKRAYGPSKPFSANWWPDGNALLALTNLKEEIEAYQKKFLADIQSAGRTRWNRPLDEAPRTPAKIINRIDPDELKRRMGGDLER